MLNRTRTHITTAVALAIVLAGMTLACSANAAEITISAGQSARPAGPLCVKLSEPLDAKRNYALEAAGQPAVPAQADGDGTLWWWNDRMEPGQKVSYKLVTSAESATGERGVKVDASKPEVISVSVDGQFVTAFNYKKADPRPYLYPVLGPTGDPVTRDWPMKDNPAEAEGKRQDHPHHRSLWTAHGDVRTPEHPDKGTDYWAMDQVKDENGKRVIRHNDKAGYQRVARIVRTMSGPVFGLIEAEVDWTTVDGKRELSDTRTYRFFRTPDGTRLMDYRLILHFPESDVTFADTKEGGLLSLRIAVTMDESAKQGGQMCNSAGGKRAGECWGKPAEWCDYAGPVNDKIVGIAVFDGPKNYGHPTHWHIRDYGLYTANPFGLNQFDKKNPNGSHTWKKGDTAEFNYRLVIHKGDAKAAGIAEQYALFSLPPEIAAH